MFPDVAVIGCLRLASGEEVELSASPERHSGRPAVCVNIKYSPNDIPSTCSVGLGRFTLGNIDIARQGPDAYELTGATTPEVQEIVLGYRSATGESATLRAPLIQVGSELATRVGAPGPFGYFVGLIPSSAKTCSGVTVQARGLRGHPLASESLGANDSILGGIPLPGHRRCGPWSATAQ